MTVMENNKKTEDTTSYEHNTDTCTNKECSMCALYRIYKKGEREGLHLLLSEALEDYTRFLLKYNYVDDDVWSEEPNAIERYLSEHTS